MKLKKKRARIYFLFILLNIESLLSFVYGSSSPNLFHQELFAINGNETGLKLYRTKRGVGKNICYSTSYKFGYTKKQTVEKCVEVCWQHRHNVAMLRQGEMCNCLMKLQEAKQVDMNNCKKPCKGNPLQNCGGDNDYAVYPTGYQPEPHFAKERSNSPPMLKIFHKGCFTQPRGKLKNQLKFHSLRMIIPMCVATCRSNRHNHAGLFMHTGCYCFYSLNGLRKVSFESCGAKRCAGEGKMYCGGSNNEMNVYETGKKFSENGGVSTAKFAKPAWLTPVVVAKGGYNSFKPKKVAPKRKFKPVYNPNAKKRHKNKKGKKYSSKKRKGRQKNLKSDRGKSKNGKPKKGKPKKGKPGKRNKISAKTGKVAGDSKTGKIKQKKPSNKSDTAVTETSNKAAEGEKKQDYMYIGIGAGVVFVLLLCFCQQKQKAAAEKEKKEKEEEEERRRRRKKKKKKKKKDGDEEGGGEGDGEGGEGNAEEG